MRRVIQALGAIRTSAVMSAILGGIFAGLFVGKELYGSLLVDRPVAWRAVPQKGEWTHRGLHLAIQDGVEFYLWGPDDPGFEVVAKMDSPDRPESLVKMARAARWHGCSRIVLLPGNGSQGGWQAYALRSRLDSTPGTTPGSDDSEGDV